MEETIQFKLNGKSVTLTADSDRMLLWILRADQGLTGTKYGCGEGYCGACTVLVNDEAVRSCQTPLKDIQGKEVVTIEGLEKNAILHPLQKAFMKHDALQCGDLYTRNDSQRVFLSAEKCKADNVGHNTGDG